MPPAYGFSAVTLDARFDSEPEATEDPADDTPITAPR